MPKNPSVLLEWLFETLDKRIGPPYYIKIAELFLVVPWPEESELDYELGTSWKLVKGEYVNQGNNLNQSYPHLARLLNTSNKVITIKTFFVNSPKLKFPLILWHKKFPYPKINKVKPNNSLNLIT